MDGRSRADTEFLVKMKRLIDTSDLDEEAKRVLYELVLEITKYHNNYPGFLTHHQK